MAIGIDVPLVVTRIPRHPRQPAAKDTRTALVRPGDFAGARLVLVTTDGQVRPLTPGFDSACDPNVSFDGQRVLFAGRREPGARWRIWETWLNGLNPRPISPADLEARSPIHVSTLFTLDSPQPWYTTVFVGADSTLNEAGQTGAFSLYNIKLDGTELRRLTFNPNANLDPFQMWDGRLLYAAERHPVQPGAARAHVGIYAVHIEGADVEFYGAERANRIQRTPCATGTGLIVFVESAAPTADGSGQLACVEEQRPHLTYRPITRNPALVYRHPAPLQGNKVLVSRRSTRRQADWGVFAVDADQGTCEPVFDTPDFHEVQAVVAAPRRSPDGHSTVVETRFDTGILYGLNCYDAEPRLAPHIRPPMVKRVRLIEGVPAAAATPRNAPRAATPFVQRRLVGEAPVEADGSFNVEVPADVPLLLQTLDERGLALATCGWFWVKPREKRGCIGCHEDPERVPENEYVLALTRPSNRLVLSAAQRRAVNFRDDIAPILKHHCATAECHGSKKNNLQLPLTAPTPSEADLRQALAHLLAPANPGAAKKTETLPKGKYLDAGRARTSPLIWRLIGTNVARPWDLSPSRAQSPGPVHPMPQHGKGTPLSQEQLHTIIQWIDMGAQYDAPAAPHQTATAALTR
jgi:hypothetical protein